MQQTVETLAGIITDERSCKFISIDLLYDFFIARGGTPRFFKQDYSSLQISGFVRRERISTPTHVDEAIDATLDLDFIEPVLNLFRVNLQRKSSMFASNDLTELVITLVTLLMDKQSLWLQGSFCDLISWSLEELERRDQAVASNSKIVGEVLRFTEGDDVNRGVLLQLLSSTNDRIAALCRTLARRMLVQDKPAAPLTLQDLSTSILADVSFKVLPSTDFVALEAKASILRHALGTAQEMRENLSAAEEIGNHLHRIYARINDKSGLHASMSRVCIFHKLFLFITPH